MDKLIPILGTTLSVKNLSVETFSHGTDGGFVFVQHGGNLDGSCVNLQQQTHLVLC